MRLQAQGSSQACSCPPATLVRLQGWERKVSKSEWPEDRSLGRQESQAQEWDPRCPRPSSLGGGAALG